ncbi:7255_t:CDS:1, partial [Racocetra persica]
TAERQSLASKLRINDGAGKRRIGKKPDIMALEKCERKLVEYLYLESSRIICNDTKKNDDETKLWRELLDGISYINSACRPTSNQFGVVGIQVAGEKISLNVLINDASGIPRYFHVDHAEIPLTSGISWR